MRRHAQGLSPTQGGRQFVAEARAVLEGLNPQNRLFQPSEVTAAALYLASEGARGVNGQCITIAGGEL